MKVNLIKIKPNHHLKIIIYIEALSRLDKASITEMKTFKRPPNTLANVGICLCIIFRIKNPSWENAIKIISKPEFLSQMLAYDMNNVSKEIADQLRPYVTSPDFKYESIKSVSKAAANIYYFICAVYNAAANK